MDVNFFAIVSDSPKFCAANFANLSTWAVMDGNVTSTTFWTSLKSEPSSRQDFPKSTIFFTAKADASIAPAFFAREETVLKLFPKSFSILEAVFFAELLIPKKCFFTFPELSALSLSI